MNQSYQLTDYNNPNFWKKKFPKSNDDSYKAYKDRLEYGKHGEYRVIQKLQKLYSDIESYSYGDKVLTSPYLRLPFSSVYVRSISVFLSP